VIRCPDPLSHERMAESREGIEPSRLGLQSRIRACESARTVERPGFAPGSLTCDASVLLLDDRPEAEGRARSESNAVRRIWNPTGRHDSRAQARARGAARVKVPP